MTYFQAIVLGLAQGDVYKRQCQESVKFAEKDRFPEIMYLIPTDILRESGMLIFRLYESKKTEQ